MGILNNPILSSKAHLIIRGQKVSIKLKQVLYQMLQINHIQLKLKA